MKNEHWKSLLLSVVLLIVGGKVASVTLAQ